MPNHPQVVVTEAMAGGWFPDTQQSWIDLKIDDENTLRLVFADDFPPTLKLCLQQGQKHTAEERKKAGLPLLEQTYVETVERIEFGRDDVTQIALIRTHFQNGAVRDTPVAKKHIRQTIEFLEAALQAFEKLSKSQKH